MKSQLGPNFSVSRYEHVFAATDKLFENLRFLLAEIATPVTAYLSLKEE